jgi:hypothetical protein
MAVPKDPETLLTRRELAEALGEVGFPIAVATLNTKASRGGGPPYRRFGPRALHPWGLSLEWAREKLGPLVSSTAELDALKAGAIQDASEAA